MKCGVEKGRGWGGNYEKDLDGHEGGSTVGWCLWAVREPLQQILESASPFYLTPAHKSRGRDWKSSARGFLPGKWDANYTLFLV